MQASVADAFVEKLVSATSALSLGNGLADGVDLGPLVNNRAVHDVDALVRATVEAGATVALGGAPVNWVGISISRPFSLMSRPTWLCSGMRYLAP